MWLNQQLPFKVSYNRCLQILTCLLQKFFQIMTTCFFLFSFHLFLADLLFGDFIPAYSHSYSPSFVLFDASFAQYNFNHARLLDRNQILRIFAPVSIIFDITFFLTHSILFDLYFSRPSSWCLCPLPLYCCLLSLRQLRYI